MFEPKDRLGAGEEDSQNSMDTLKSHSFFETIDFNQIQNEKAPIDSRNII